MRYIKWILILLVTVFVAGFLHYTLPQRDVVKVIDAYEKRMDVANNSLFWGQPDSGTTQQDTRDVRFIDTIQKDGSVMVYRNEDTSLGWPPYFKFKSSDIGAQAKQLATTEAKEQWVSITHYGWRNQYFSIFPNAVKIRPVDGPDATYIPWFNIIFFILLALCLLGLFRLWQRFRRRRIDPVIEDMEETWDGISERGATFGDRMRGWFKGLGGR